MSSLDPIHIHTDGPVKPVRSVRQLAQHLGLDFKPESLQLSVVALARHVESLQFEVALLKHELRQPLWKRAVDRLKGEAR